MNCSKHIVFSARRRICSQKLGSINCDKTFAPISMITRRLSISIDNIRNVGIVAHIDAGKTTTSEQMLFVCGRTKTVGRVDTGDTIMDFLPQERERGITISSAAISMKWREYIINLIDTPGHVDFTIEVERSTRVLDGAVIVLDAVSGVQAQTKTVWKQVNKQNIPAIAFVNKMDRDGASFKRAVETLKSKLGVYPIPIQLPVGKEDNFNGVIDLISMTKILWKESVSRTPAPPILESISIEDDLYEEAISARKEMLESIAEVDEEFLEKFLETDSSGLSANEIIAAIRRACLKNLALPTLSGASLRGKGVEPLLNTITTFLPSPVERKPIKAVSTTNNKNTLDIRSNDNNLCAYAFKIVNDKDRGPLVFVRIFSGVLAAKQVLRNSSRNVRERANQLLNVSADDLENITEVTSGNVACIVGLKDTRTGDTLVAEKSPLQSYVLDGLAIPPPVYSLSIEPESSTQQKEFETALKIMTLEDPSLVVELNKESGQTILKGIGELHLEVVCDKIRRDHNIEVYTGRSYVAFRETIVSTAETGCIVNRWTYDKSTGNKRMFASVEFEISSSDRSSEPTIDLPDQVKSGLSADEYTALIDGLRTGFTRGPLGFPVVGLHVKVREVEKDSDTTPGAIRACAAMLLDNILRGEHREILEPIMSTEVDVPTQFVGEVLSDLSVKRRGSITEVITAGSRSIVIGEVPFATMLGYATTIRSLTQGEGNFCLEFSHYSSVALSDLKNF